MSKHLTFNLAAERLAHAEIKSYHRDSIRAIHWRISLRCNLEMLNPHLCLFVCSLLLPKPWTSVQREKRGGGCGSDGRPHGEGLFSLSLSAHLTAAMAGLPKARPQAKASCGPPAGLSSLPKPIRAPLLPPPPERPPPSPAALCPKMPLLSVLLLSALK